jgi:glycosyltransferase involved in cell wall biosynthesis
MEDFYALGRRTVISIPNGIPEGTVAEMVQDIDPEMNAWIDFGKEIHASGQLLVGIVGRLNAMKGHDLLLQAIAQVPGIHAVILGDGELRSDLEQLARRLGVGDRIHFLGWVENPRAYLPYLDIVALPSRSEGFPLAMVEAMLAARAIVATPVGSVAEAILDGETGLLVAKDDAIALAQALTQLRDQPELRFKLGQQAREKAIAEFTAAHMAQQYETLWYELRERPRRSRFWVGQPKE